MHETPRLAVIGLGKLGACLLGVFADVGFDVIGADVDAETVNALNHGAAPPRVTEPGLPSLVASAHALATHDLATTDVAAACENVDVAFVVVPTPSGADDRFDASMVCEAVRSVCVGFRRRTRGSVPVVVVVSTVMPGTCGTEVTRVINAAGFTVGDDIGLDYSPEFIALGTVIRDLRNPDTVYLGSDHVWSANVLGSVYARVAPDAPQVRLSLVDAEVAKLATNVYLSVKIGWANEVARMCEAIRGADAGAVLDAVGGDSRVGSRYLSAGDWAGGPCLPRDSRAWGALARWCGRDSHFAPAAARSNADVLDWVLTAVEDAECDLPDDVRSTVAVLGLSYKAGSPVVDDSLGWAVAEHLSGSDGRFVAVYDPMVVAVPHGCHVLPSLPETIVSAEFVVVATADEAFRGLVPMSRQTFIDVWSICVEGDGRIIRPGITTNG